MAGALPQSLKSIGLDVRLILPLYRTVRSGDFDIRPLGGDVEILTGNQRLKAGIGECRTGGDVPVYFVEREDLFDRPRLYGNEKGDYYDNLERFAFFSKAALKIAEAVSFKPDIIHCHDWQTGLVPCLVRDASGSDVYADTPTVFTIHNLGYQGLFPEEKMQVTGLRSEEFFHPEGLEYWGQISLLKAGINFSDAITTVSPTYAKEIRTPGYGMGMEGILEKRKSVLHGILNGIDYGHWDPAKDNHISATYTHDALQGKEMCKAALIKAMGLDGFLEKRPLLAMVTRLDKQKGLDLLLEIVEQVLGLDVGVAVLGSGSEEIQRGLADVAGKHPGRFGLRLGFDETLAHRIIAGADMLLIPSRYEPCGLTQMYALKYGSVPIVRATGGLADSVTTFSQKKGKGTGFKFRAYTGRAFFSAIKKAVSIFEDPGVWSRLMKNGMTMDFSWTRSARTYGALYASVAGAGKERTGEGE